MTTVYALTLSTASSQIADTAPGPSRQTSNAYSGSHKHCTGLGRWSEATSVVYLMFFAIYGVLFNYPWGFGMGGGVNPSLDSNIQALWLLCLAR